MKNLWVRSQEGGEENKNIQNGSADSKDRNGDTDGATHYRFTFIDINSFVTIMKRE
jgi:hypothetical protein